MKTTISFYAVLVLCALMLAGCTSSTPEGKPMPELTFAHIVPLPVDVAAIAVENKYDPSADPRDMSSSFPTPPDIVLRRYADKRLQATGPANTLKFVIEDAPIYQSLVQPAGNFTLWMGMKRKELYEVAMKIRMFTVDDAGQESTHSILNIRRSIAIPERYSLSRKEEEKFKFLEMLMDDVDRAVTQTLTDKMNLAGLRAEAPAVPNRQAQAPASVASLLAAPEIR